MKYTIAQLSEFTSLAQIEGKLETGSIRAVKYKQVYLEPSETYTNAIIVQYGQDPLTIITDPAKFDQFIHRGC